jgi:predicted Rossmann-fold nucleotide-binding protein
MYPVIGVVGRTTGAPDAATLARVSLLGRTIAERGCTLMVVCRAGLSHAAEEGARAVGSQVVSIPPADTVDGDDEVIRRSDIVIIVGGRFGPPGELATAYAARRPIGVLTQSRGVGNAIEALVRVCARPNAGPVICDAQPDRLVDRLITCHRTV